MEDHGDEPDGWRCAVCDMFQVGDTEGHGPDGDLCEICDESGAGYPDLVGEEEAGFCILKSELREDGWHFERCSLGGRTDCEKGGECAYRFATYSAAVAEARRRGFA